MCTRLIAHMGFRADVQRASMLGLGCAGALPSLQRASDFVQAHRRGIALVLAVEICSACDYIDDTMETVGGNAICADGAAACVLTRGRASPSFPSLVDFESFLYPDQLHTVGFEQRHGKLRIILGPEISALAAPLIEEALGPLLQRQGLERRDIRFWVAHPGGRKVIDHVQKAFGLSDADVVIAAWHLPQLQDNHPRPALAVELDHAAAIVVARVRDDHDCTVRRIGQDVDSDHHVGGRERLHRRHGHRQPVGCAKR